MKTVCVTGADSRRLLKLLLNREKLLIPEGCFSREGGDIDFTPFKAGDIVVEENHCIAISNHGNNLMQTVIPVSFGEKFHEIFREIDDIVSIAILRQIDNNCFPTDPNRTFNKYYDDNFNDLMPPINTVKIRGEVGAFFQRKSIRTFRWLEKVKLGDVITWLNNSVCVIDFCDHHVWQPLLEQAGSFRSQYWFSGVDRLGAITLMEDLPESGTINKQRSNKEEYFHRILEGRREDLIRENVDFSYHSSETFFSGLGLSCSCYRGTGRCYIYRDGEGEYNLFITDQWGGHKIVRFEIYEEIYDHRGEGIVEHLMDKVGTDCLQNIYSYLSPCCSKDLSTIECNNSRFIGHSITLTGFHREELDDTACDSEAFGIRDNEFKNDYERGNAGKGFPVMSPSDLVERLASDYKIERRIVKKIMASPAIGKKALKELYGLDCKRYVFENIKKINRCVKREDASLSKVWKRKIAEYREINDKGSYKEICDRAVQINTPSFMEILSLLERQPPDCSYTNPEKFVKEIDFLEVHHELKKKAVRKELKRLEESERVIIKSIPENITWDTDLSVKDLKKASKQSVIESYEHYNKCPRNYNERIFETGVKIRNILSRREVRKMGRVRYRRKCRMNYLLSEVKKLTDSRKKNPKYVLGVLKIGQQQNKDEKVLFAVKKLKSVAMGDIYDKRITRLKKGQLFGDYISSEYGWLVLKAKAHIMGIWDENPDLVDGLVNRVIKLILSSCLEKCYLDIKEQLSVVEDPVSDVEDENPPDLFSNDSGDY